MEIACLEENCCEATAACTEGGEDLSGCQACLQEGGGAQCDDLIACRAECGITYGWVCDSGVNTTDADYSACLSESCCEEFSACT